jgi:hypothetical protein
MKIMKITLIFFLIILLQIVVLINSIQVETINVLMLYKYYFVRWWWLGWWVGRLGRLGSLVGLQPVVGKGSGYRNPLVGVQAKHGEKEVFEFEGEVGWKVKMSSPDFVQDGNYVLFTRFSVLVIEGKLTYGK